MVMSALLGNDVYHTSIPIMHCFHGQNLTSQLLEDFLAL